MDTLEQLPTPTMKWTCNDDCSIRDEPDDYSRVLIIGTHSGDKLDALLDKRSQLSKGRLWFPGQQHQVRSIDSAPAWVYHVAQAPICSPPNRPTRVDNFAT
jgi:hypothetical protein